MNVAEPGVLITLFAFLFAIVMYFIPVSEMMFPAMKFLVWIVCVLVFYVIVYYVSWWVTAVLMIVVAAIILKVIGPAIMAEGMKMRADVRLVTGK